MQEYQVLIEKAKELSLQKNYSDSLNIYKELESKISLLTDLQKAKVYAGIGNILRMELSFKNAIEYFEKSLALSPRNKLALKGIANSYRGMKDRDRELFWWLKYIEVDKNDFLAMTRIADVYRRNGNLEKAEEFYLATLKLQHTNKFALMGLGDLYYKCKNYDKALIYWERLLELYPDFINIITMVGNIYRLRRDFEKAQKYYAQAYQSSPNNNYVLYGIADTLRGEKKYAESLPYWIKLLEKDSNNSRIITRIGDAYFLNNQIEKAESSYKKAWEQFNDKYGYIGLIRIKSMNGSEKEILSMIQELIKRFGSDIRIANIASEMLINIGYGDQIEPLISPYHNIYEIPELASKVNQVSN